MDHETALQAANQALGGSAPRARKRLSSRELGSVGWRAIERDGVDEGAPARGSAVPERRLSRAGAWEIAAMAAVAAATLLFVLGLWFS